MYWKLFKLSSYFYKIAATLAETIGGMNLSQEIIQFLESIPDDKKGYYIGFLKKNPNASFEDLQNIEIKKEQEPEFYEVELKKVINFVPHDAKEWVKIWIKKLRRGMSISQKGQDIIDDYIYGGIQTIQQAEMMLKMTKIEGKTSKFEVNPSLAPYVWFICKVRRDEFRDWVENATPNLASYTPEQAFKAVEEWHEAMAAEGAGMKYEEGSKNIVYGPNWEIPEWNGWTIRKITTDNDLKVEGNLMNHCVGSYCENVSSGNSDIYSLRDSSNNPHVTMEARGETYNFEQIQGNSNSEPKQEYKEMVKEWFQKLKRGGRTVITKSLYSEIDNWSDDWFKARRQIDALENNDEYGTAVDYIESNSVREFYKTFYRFADNINSGEPAEKLAEILHKKDKLHLEYMLVDEKNYISPFSSDEERKFYWKGNSGIAHVLSMFREYDKKFEHYDIDSYHNPANGNIPNPNDYENGENDDEYMYEIRKIEKAEKQFIKEYRQDMPFAFQDSLLENMREYQKIDPIPDYNWMGDNKWSLL